MVERYTQTISALIGSLHMDDKLDVKIYDVLPRLFEARAKCYTMSGLTASPHSDIIEDEIRKKDNWVKGDRGLFAGSVPYSSRVKLAKGEYKKIVSEINTNYGRYAGKKNCTHYSLWNDKFYGYRFTNNGFDDYTFIKKWED